MVDNTVVGKVMSCPLVAVVTREVATVVTRVFGAIVKVTGYDGSAWL